MRRIHLINIAMVCVISLAFLALVPGCATTPEKTYKIGECQIVDHPDLNACREGFHQGMAEKGFIEGENVEYISLNAEGDMSVAHTIASRFVTEKVDLIHAIATPMAQACAAVVEGLDIPMIFTAVSDPVGAGLVESWERPGPHNITGVSDRLNTDDTLNMIKAICPNFKVMGIVYDAGETNAVATVAQMKESLSKAGFSQPVEANCPTSAEVKTAAESLVGRCDVIWWPDSNTVAQGCAALVSVCEEHKIPVFGPTGWSVEPEYGCIGACGVSDYTAVGIEAGYMAARILLGEDPANIPVTTPAAEQLPTLNPAAAERMGVTIPQWLLDKARKVVIE
jgi:putative ABC transport system substrate-binding protein